MAWSYPSGLLVKNIRTLARGCRQKIVYGKEEKVDDTSNDFVKELTLTKQLRSSDWKNIVIDFQHFLALL